MSTTIEQRRAAIRAAEQDMLRARDEHQGTQAAIRPAVAALYELRQANPDPARENEMLMLFGKRTWSLPGFLDRIIPDLDLEGNKREAPASDPDLVAEA